MVNDGGPAFPRPGHGVVIDDVDQPQDGMSLRDWFAGQAVGDTAYFALEDSVSVEKVARHAYKIADAMLQERDREQGAEPLYHRPDYQILDHRDQLVRDCQVKGHIPQILYGGIILCSDCLLVWLGPRQQGDWEHVPGAIHILEPGKKPCVHSVFELVVETFPDGSETTYHRCGVCAMEVQI